MDIGQLAEDTSNGRVGSVLLTIMLGGFLWVGKTTFEHVGQFSGLRHEIELSDHQAQSLRVQYDEIVKTLNERTKSRFTREDGEKLMDYVKSVEIQQGAFKDSFLRDYTGLKVEIASATTPNAYQPRQYASSSAHNNPIMAAGHIQQLESEIYSLRSELFRIRRHLGMNGNQVQATLEPSRLAQPGPDRTPVVRR